MFDKWEELKKYILYLTGRTNMAVPDYVYRQSVWDMIDFSPQTILNIMKRIEDEEENVGGE